MRDLFIFPSESASWKGLSYREEGEYRNEGDNRIYRRKGENNSILHPKVGQPALLGYRELQGRRKAVKVYRRICSSWAVRSHERSPPLPSPRSAASPEGNTRKTATLAGEGRAASPANQDTHRPGSSRGHNHHHAASPVLHKVLHELSLNLILMWRILKRRVDGWQERG